MWPPPPKCTHHKWVLCLKMIKHFSSLNGITLGFILTTANSFHGLNVRCPNLTYPLNHTSLYCRTMISARLNFASQLKMQISTKVGVFLLSTFSYSFFLNIRHFYEDLIICESISSPLKESICIGKNAFDFKTLKMGLMIKKQQGAISILRLLLPFHQSVKIRRWIASSPFQMTWLWSGTILLAPNYTPLLNNASNHLSFM